MNSPAPERQKIISYSQQKFFSEGFHKTTMDEIARGLSISKNTLYKHFPNKEKLVMEAITAFIGSVAFEVEALVSSDHNAVYKFFHLMKILSHKLIFISDKMLRDLQIHAPHIWRKIDDLRKTLMSEKLGRLLTQGKREGLFIDYPTELIQMIFISSLRSVVNPEFLINTKVSREEAVTTSFRILLRGTLTAKGTHVLKKIKTPL